MTFYVFGAGLVGSYLGALGGAQQAMRRHAAVINERIRAVGHTISWHPESLGHLPEDGPLLVATRCHQTPWKRVRPGWLAAQNGIGQTCPVMVCFCAIDRAADGSIFHCSQQQPRLVLAKHQPMWTAAIEHWRAHGILVEEVADVTPYQWEKAILNATLGPLCLATGKSMAKLWSENEMKSLVLEASAEGLHIAKSIGVIIPDGFIQRTISFFDQVGNHRPSIIADCGELSWLFNPLLEAADNHHLPCPALRRIAGLCSALQE